MDGIRFRDRVEAGRFLAERLRGYAGRGDVTVFGLSRGGVPVGCEVARALSAPFDVWVVRKVGVPGYEELAMGAIASGGGMVLDEALVGELGISGAEIRRVVERERVELHRREQAYTGQRPPLRLEGRTVIMVDDGLATGATMHAAVLAVRRRRPARIVVAVPVAAGATVARLRELVDDVVCGMVPEVFRAVGEWYEDFSPISDAEVEIARLRAGSVGRDASIVIPAGDVALAGDLVVPPGAKAVVVFAHGSGSGRRSPRNTWVAGALNRAGIGTLLIDLLTLAEQRVDSASGRYRFDIPLLSSRLIAAVDWLQGARPGSGVGLFGASTGAAAALIAAAAHPDAVFAVVSRGGRPDLAGPALGRVRAPTLLIVGGGDLEVLQLNRLALDKLRAVKRLEVIPGAGHLFEEPGALDHVTELAARWFSHHLRAPDGAS